MAVYITNGAQLIRESGGKLKLLDMTDASTKRISWYIEVARGKYQLTIDESLSNNEAFIIDLRLFVSREIYNKLKDVDLAHETFSELTVTII